MYKYIVCLILSVVMVGTLLTACGNDTTDENQLDETEIVELKAKEPSLLDEKSDGEDETSSFNGEWADDYQKVTIKDDTVTIEYLNNEGDVSEVYWVGSYEYEPEPKSEVGTTEDSETAKPNATVDDNSTDSEENSNSEFETVPTSWTSVRDSSAEMTCESDTLKFMWSGEKDNVYGKLSYSVENKNGSTTLVTLDRSDDSNTVLDDSGAVAGNTNNDETGSNQTGASAVKESESGGSTEASSNVGNSSVTMSDSVGNNGMTSDNGSLSQNSDSSSNSSSGNSGSGVSSNTSSGNSGSSNSGSTNTNTGNTNSNSSSSGSSGSSGSSSSGSSSNPGTTTTACSHNYQGVVTKNATCSTAGVKTYTCSKCGASYTESIPATGNHNWQAVYKTVHHDATGHYETTPITEYRLCICTGCGWFEADVTGISDLNQVSHWMNHCAEAHDGKYGYTSGMVQVGTTQTWVTDSNAYDEQVVDHYVCSVCGGTK